MKQKRIRTITDALDRADQAIGGATQLGVEAGPKYATADVLIMSRDNLIEARNTFDAANTELANRRSVRDSLIESMKMFVTNARNVLVARLDKDNAAEWAEAGFARSRGIPRPLAKLKMMTHAVCTYLAKHPALEVVELNVTSARAAALLEQVRAAENAVNSQKGLVGTLKVERDAKYALLTSQLRYLVTELGQLFDPLDPRWLTFGLNRPGAKQTPEAPQEVTAVLVSETAAAVEWPPAPRVDHYRIYKKVVGVDAELIAVGSAWDRDFMLEDLPRHSQVELALSAVNDGGESPLSAVITITTG